MDVDFTTAFHESTLSTGRVLVVFRLLLQGVTPGDRWPNNGSFQLSVKDRRFCRSLSAAMYHVERKIVQRINNYALKDN